MAASPTSPSIRRESTPEASRHELEHELCLMRFTKCCRSRVPPACSQVPCEEVVGNVLQALQRNDFPEVNSGLLAFWSWTHELYRGRPVNGHGNFSIFAERAHNSELGPLMNCEGWTLEPLNVVGAGEKYATQVARVRPRGDAKGIGRRFLFQLRRELRPPYNGAWSMWGVIISESDGSIQDLSGGF